MVSQTKTGYLSSPRFRDHQTGPGHPESPSRLDAIDQRLRENSFLRQLVLLKPVPADLKWILKVHSGDYLDRLKSLSTGSGLVYLDPDTPVSPLSFQTALLASGGVLAAVDEIVRGSLRNAFCAVRPPGHHARIGRGMGFCLINHAAVASRYLQERHGLQRVAIIDWDVHHGNGTQEIFYEDPTVFYFSVHQYPFYPGTGSAEETGHGKGEGFTLNCPLEPGGGDSEYLEIFEGVLFPRLEIFQPQFILVSAGFDAHRDDPLARMEVSSEGFGRLTSVVKQMASAFCGGKLISLLEGGYNLEALAESVENHLRVLME